MTELVARIKQLARERLMTLRDLSERAQIARQTIYYWGKGRKPDVESLQKIANALGTTVEELLDGTVETRPVKEIVRGSPVPPGWRPVKRIKLKFSAGGGAEDVRDGEEMAEDEEGADVLYLPDSFFYKYRTDEHHCRVACVSGDSMEPTLYDGDEVIFLEEKCPEAPEIRDGKLYVLHDGSGFKVKRLSRLMDGTLVVRSDNPIYKDIEIKPEDQDLVRVYGRVLRQIRDF